MLATKVPVCLYVIYCKPGPSTPSRCQRVRTAPMVCYAQVHMMSRSLCFSASPPKMESMACRARAHIWPRSRSKCCATRRYSLERGLPKTPTSSVCSLPASAHAYSLATLRIPGVSIVLFRRAPGSSTSYGVRSRGEEGKGGKASVQLTPSDSRGPSTPRQWPK